MLGSGPTLKPDTCDSHGRLSFPVPLPEPSTMLGHFICSHPTPLPPRPSHRHLWPAHTPCLVLESRSALPPGAGGGGNPASDRLPALPCLATHGESSCRQPSPLSGLSPSLSTGSQLASVASFCSLAIPSLSPSRDFASSVPATPPPRNTLSPSHGWFPSLQGSAALSPPLGGPP